MVIEESIGHRYKSPVPFVYTDKGFLGLSLGYPLFNNNISEVIDTADKQFHNFLLIVGDYLYRHNYQWYYGVNENRAITIARSRGDKMLKKIRKKLAEPTLCNFNVIRWEELTKRKSFTEFHQEVNRAVRHNIELGDVFKQCAAEFVDYREKLGTVILDRNRAIELSTNFLIEEIAVFAMLAEEGWIYDTYPGRQLPIFELLSKRHYPEMPKPLYKIKYVGKEVFNKII